MLRREEESEAEVRREDQENINRFAQFNARLHELRSEKTLLQVCILFALTLCVLSAVLYSTLTFVCDTYNCNHCSELSKAWMMHPQK